MSSEDVLGGVDRNNIENYDKSEDCGGRSRVKGDRLPSSEFYRKDRVDEKPRFIFPACDGLRIKTSERMYAYAYVHEEAVTSRSRTALKGKRAKQREKGK